MSDKEEKQKITCNMYYGQYAEFLTIYKKKKRKSQQLYRKHGQCREKECEVFKYAQSHL